MADPKRFESHATETADRDSRTEALLVEGLDRYFAGQYEEAIHIWTRVLFLDRNHARPRLHRSRLHDPRRTPPPVGGNARGEPRSTRAGTDRSRPAPVDRSRGDDGRRRKSRGASSEARAAGAPGKRAPATPGLGSPERRRAGDAAAGLALARSIGGRAPRRGGRDRGGPRGSGHASVGLRLAGSALIDRTAGRSTVTPKWPTALELAVLAFGRREFVAKLRDVPEFVDEIGGNDQFRHGSRLTSCESKSNSYCSQVDRSALAPRRTDDEMSEVPLLELRTRAALQTLRLLVFDVRA